MVGKLLYAALVVRVMALFAAGFLACLSGSGRTGKVGSEFDFTAVLRWAAKHLGYLLLTAGFFVYELHVAFITTHLPSFLVDHGVAQMVGATPWSLIGLFKMLGSYLFGRLGDCFRKQKLLSLLYFARAVVIACFLIVPVTSGTVAQIFRTRHLSSLYGIVFLSHQVGAFLGVWLGGRIYDATGSYDWVWIGAIALGVAAEIVHLPIRDQALSDQRLAPGRATA